MKYNIGDLFLSHKWHLCYIIKAWQEWDGPPAERETIYYTFAYFDGQRNTIFSQEEIDEWFSEKYKIEYYPVK
jgi:hypothetical protein